MHLQQQARPLSMASSAAAASWSNTLSFASPESDFCSSSSISAAAAAQTQGGAVAVPTTLQQAMTSPHPVVVTTMEAPHRIVHVNVAWEGLCGYTQAEVLGRSLSIIQGRDTNAPLTHQTVQSVLADPASIADMYVVNYKKNGTPFKNHVTLGTMMLSEEQADVKFLVGVLEEVEHVPLRMIQV
jgi:PAS domain S-box-containing protein